MPVQRGRFHIHEASLAQHPGVLSMRSVSSEVSKAAILVDHRRKAEVGPEAASLLGFRLLCALTIR
jgi:hypothetical protein